jgi:transcriptional regulator with GAF, ATPase, and Fis domain
VTPAATPSPGRALAAVTSALVQSHHVTDVLVHLLQETASALGAQAAGLLVYNGTGELELLASTSHSATELEIYQTQSREGPCIDSLRLLHPVLVAGERDMTTRWPGAGPRIVAAGFRTVHAGPLRWHSRALGGLNVFFSDPVHLDAEQQAFAQAFADVATLALVQTQEPSDRELAAHIHAALEARTLVEHAKGVLVETRDLDPATAYSTLLRMASTEGLPLTELARNLIWEAQRP